MTNYLNVSNSLLLYKDIPMTPATINQINNEYQVYFNRQVVGVHATYQAAELHAHDINREHFLPKPPMFITIA